MAILAVQRDGTVRVSDHAASPIGGGLGRSLRAAVYRWADCQQRTLVLSASSPEVARLYAGEGFLPVDGGRPGSRMRRPPRQDAATVAEDSTGL